MRTLLVVCVFCLLTAGLMRADVTKGADVYKTKCASCHGPDGKGQTPIAKSMKLRDLTSEDVQKQHDSELKTWIQEGKGKMPSFKNKLTNQQVEDLIQFLRSLRTK